jgi:hypothetical protein
VAIGTPRGLGHRARVRVDPQDERVGLRRGHGEDGTAVAGAEVDDDPAMSPGQAGELADVDLGDAPAADDAHARSMPDDRHRPLRTRGPAIQSA